MKNLLCILISSFLVICSFGCDSDDDDRIDNSAIINFMNFGGDLKVFLQDTNFGLSKHSLGDSPTQEEEDDYSRMFSDTYLQKAYCDLVYTILEEFNLVNISDTTYSDKTRANRPPYPTTITLIDNIYTLATSYYGYVSDPEVFEELHAVMTYNPASERWIIRAYRGGDSTGDIWLLQEGVVSGSTIYTTMQRVDAGTFYKANFMVTGTGTASVLNTCGQTDSGAITQRTLYTNGITTANDEWSEFRIFEITPDYEFSE